MYEKRNHPLLKRSAFFARLLQHFSGAALLVGLSLYAGIIGYRELESMSWIDATLNASMILGGMGPVGELKTDAGKLFASAYALYSGMLFLVTAAVVFAPLIHRLLHRFHLDRE
ncbi:MAG: hypothetical protein WBM54_04460 [Woeseia sp.]